MVHQAVDKGSGKRLKRVYAVKQSVAVPKRVPFRQALNEVMMRKCRSATEAHAGSDGDRDEEVRYLVQSMGYAKSLAAERID